MIIAGLAAFCVMLALQWAAPASAHADTISDLQKKVEETAAEYNDAVDQVEALEKQIEENEAEIARIEELLPGMRENARESACTLYQFNRDQVVLFEILLSSDDLSEFFQTYEYLDAVNSHNSSEIESLAIMEAELKDRQAQLESDKEKAEEEVDRADQAQKDAQEARKKAEEEAIAAARRQAEQQATLLAQKELQAKLKSQRAGIDSANETSEVAGSEDVQELSGTVSVGDVDWSADKEEFVEEWSKRIDDYLAGSALAGQGEVFATAAWDNGVDPRWSPAISCVESSKGGVCFKPCNAWGWGSYSFDSWEDAINGHVAYLGEMYGSTITPEAASIYCPPNASLWYNRCIEEMELI